LHSITSSARARSIGGTSRPSALAVLRLILGGSLHRKVGRLLAHEDYEAKRRPGSVADFVTGIRPACSAALAWPGLTAPPAPAHPVGRSVEHPGSGIVRSPGGARGTSGRHRCSAQ